MNVIYLSERQPAAQKPAFWFDRLDITQSRRPGAADMVELGISSDESTARRVTAMAEELKAAVGQLPSVVRLADRSVMATKAGRVECEPWPEYGPDAFLVTAILPRSAADALVLALQSMGAFERRWSEAS